MSDYNVKQCKLKHFSETTFSMWYSTQWIPEKFAKENTDIEVYEPSTDRWYPWSVEEVYEVPVDYDYIRERSQDYKRTRKASDI